MFSELPSTDTSCVTRSAGRAAGLHCCPNLIRPLGKVVLQISMGTFGQILDRALALAYMASVECV